MSHTQTMQEPALVTIYFEVTSDFHPYLLHEPKAREQVTSRFAFPTRLASSLDGMRVLARLVNEELSILEQPEEINWDATRSDRTVLCRRQLTPQEFSQARALIAKFVLKHADKA